MSEQGYGGKGRNRLGEWESEGEVRRWTVRRYGEVVGDYQMVSSWMEERGMGGLMENLLPPTGIVVECDGEAVAASWLYLCYGIGVGFWEGLVARPGISLGVARAACGHCLGVLKDIAAANDVGVIKAYARGELVRDALKRGFALVDEGLVSLITETSTEGVSSWDS